MTCCTRINMGPVSNPKLCTAEGVVFIKGVVASELAVYSLNVVVDGRLQELETNYAEANGTGFCLRRACAKIALT